MKESQNEDLKKLDVKNIIRITLLLIFCVPLFLIYILLLIRGSQVLPRRWDEEELRRYKEVSTNEESKNMSI